MMMHIISQLVTIFSPLQTDVLVALFSIFFFKFKFSVSKENKDAHDKIQNNRSVAFYLYSAKLKLLPQEALYYKVKTRRRQDKRHIETEREKQLYK